MSTTKGVRKRPKTAIRRFRKLDPREVVEALLSYNWLTHLKILSGGMRPVQMTNGANGYDCHARALLSPDDMDPTCPQLRQTIFDFKRMPKDERIRGHVHHLPDEQGRLESVYRLEPGQRVLVGVGFATAMPYPLTCSLRPRSGLASKYGIQLANSPGTIDSDYRGEAGALLINHGEGPFDIRHGMRIAQLVFEISINPTFIEVPTLADLPPTGRGADGFGSTGLR